MPERTNSTTIIALILITLSIGGIASYTRDGSIRYTNPGSRFATVEALVNYGTFKIDDTRYKGRWAVDKVKIGEHYYSSKPPMLPTLTAGVYWLYRVATGNDIVDNEKNVVWFCNLIMGAVPFAFLLIYFYKLLLLFRLSESAVIAGLGVLGFGFFGIGYATELNNHTPAAAAAMIGVYYAFRIGIEHDSTVCDWILSGFFLGLLPTLDIPSAIITCGIAVYLIGTDRRRTLQIFLPIAALPLAANLVLTYLSTGSIVPIYLRGELYHYAGSYWKSPDEFDSIDEPKLIYALHSLIGHHGIYSMTPALIPALFAKIRILKNRDHLFRETLAIAGAGVAMILLYIFKTTNYGGMCIGFRWLIPVIPLFLIFFAVWVDDRIARKKHRAWIWSTVIVTLLIGQFFALEARSKAWRKSVWQETVTDLIEKHSEPDDGREE